jgi:hypothetical protein
LLIRLHLLAPSRKLLHQLLCNEQRYLQGLGLLLLRQLLLLTRQAQQNQLQLELLNQLQLAQQIL